MSNAHILSWEDVSRSDLESELFTNLITKARSSFDVQEHTNNTPYLSTSSASSAVSLLTTPSYWSKRNSESPQSSELAINGKRLWHAIHHTCQWGAIPDSFGMARLTLTDEDRRVRDYFVSEASNLGCKISVDEIGNIFAVLPGENNDIPPIGIGSHMDTQPAGGRFDGILGVLSALEIIKTIRDAGVKTFAPIAAINWTNEEGARFTPGCTGSAVWASHIPLSKAYNLRDLSTSCTMKEELQRIGYLGKVSANHLNNPLSGHFELHIEQRRRLQDASRKIGVVTGIQGIRWYEVTIDGERAHAGSVMYERGDALVNSASIISFVNKRALEASAVATVGVLTLDKPSLNTVPGTTRFTIDIRHPSEEVLDDFELAIYAYMAGLQAENAKIGCLMTRLWRSPAVNMDEAAMSCTRAAAAKVVGDDMTMDLLSLAGHDSALVAMRVPTSMIFVPSKDGISHSPEEFTNEEECATGAQVLLEAVLEYDAKLCVSRQEPAK